MPATHVQETGTRYLHQKLAQKIRGKFITVSCTKTTLRPITLQGLCHMPHSFCVLFRARNWYQIDRHRCKFLIPDNWYQFLLPISWVCFAGIRASKVMPTSWTIKEPKVAIWNFVKWSVIYIHTPAKGSRSGFSGTKSKAFSTALIEDSREVTARVSSTAILDDLCSTVQVYS